MTTRILPIGLILLSIALGYFYVQPTYTGSITETITKMEGYDAALAAADRFTKKESELAAASNGISGTSIERLNTYLPDNVDNVQLILDLNALAARSNMSLGNFNVTLPTEESAPAAAGTAATGAPLTPTGSLVDHTDVPITATGTYQSFRVFTSALENSLRPLDIQSVKISDSKTGVYTFDFIIRIYWLH